jgi:hypothetical protein
MPTLNQVIETAYVAAWKRMPAGPEVGWKLWTELHADDPRQPVQAGNGIPGRRALRRLNRTLRRHGTRARFISEAEKALSTGRRGSARKLAYICLLKTWTSLFDPAWLKLLIKTHLNRQTVRNLKSASRLIR